MYKPNHQYQEDYWSTCWTSAKRRDLGTSAEAADICSSESEGGVLCSLSEEYDLGLIPESASLADPSELYEMSEHHHTSAVDERETENHHHLLVHSVSMPLDPSQPTATTVQPASPPTAPHLLAAAASAMLKSGTAAAVQGLVQNIENMSTSIGGESATLLSALNDEITYQITKRDELDMLVTSKGGFLIDRNKDHETYEEAQISLLRNLIDNGVHVEDKSILLIDPQQVMTKHAQLMNAYLPSEDLAPWQLRFSVSCRVNSDNVLLKAADICDCVFVCDYASEVADCRVAQSTTVDNNSQQHLLDNSGSTSSTCCSLPSSVSSDFPGDSASPLFNNLGTMSPNVVSTTTVLSPPPSSQMDSIIYDGGSTKTNQSIDQIVNDHSVNTVVVESLPEVFKIERVADPTPSGIALILRITNDNSDRRGLSRDQWQHACQTIATQCSTCHVAGVTVSDTVEDIVERVQLISSFLEVTATSCPRLSTVLVGTVADHCQDNLRQLLGVVHADCPQVSVFIADVSEFLFRDSVSLALKIYARRLPDPTAVRNMVLTNNTIVEAAPSCDTGVPLEETFVSNFEKSQVMASRGVFDRSKICNAYFVADGIYGFCSRIIYESGYSMTPEILCRNPHLVNSELNLPNTLFPSKIFGQTCDGLDCIVDSIDLPLLSIGDWLWIPQFGVKSTVVSTNFNGFESGYKIYCRVRDS